MQAKGQKDAQVKKSDVEKAPTTAKKGRVHHADETTFGRLVLKANVPVLVDFYADWCGPCRMLAPVLEELARETANAKIVKVNIDENPQLAARYGVEAIPNLKVFRDGEVVDERIGIARKTDLKKMLGG
ncbi:MAG: thioredoxin [Candidatus Anammoximicrobium sp.]|nr:thioredoxin [Candidatus Anammoximicrobium sp.]